MKQKDPIRAFSDIVITRYWLQPDGPPLGYGIYKYYRLICFAFLCIIVAGGIVTFMFHLNPFITVALDLSLIIIQQLSIRINGWYEVNEKGIPQGFVSRQTPAGVHLFDGMSRRTFLEKAGGHNV